MQFGERSDDRTLCYFVESVDRMHRLAEVYYFNRCAIGGVTCQYHVAHFPLSISQTLRDLRCSGSVIIFVRF